jgi:hypothetical protein
MIIMCTIQQKNINTNGKLHIIVAHCTVMHKNTLSVNTLLSQITKNKTVFHLCSHIFGVQNELQMLTWIYSWCVMLPWRSVELNPAD